MERMSEIQKDNLMYNPFHIVILKYPNPRQLLTEFIPSKFNQKLSPRLQLGSSFSILMDHEVPKKKWSLVILIYIQKKKKTKRHASK